MEHLKADRGHCEEVDRNQGLDVIVQERTPSLRRWSAAPDHVLGHAGLADFDAQLEQLTVDARSAPQWILPTHPADQIPNLAGNHRPSDLAPANLPGPEQAKSLAMPGDHRLRLDDGQRRAPLSPDPGENNPQQPVCWGQLWSLLGGALQNTNLMAQR